MMSDVMLHPGRRGEACFEFPSLLSAVASQSKTYFLPTLSVVLCSVPVVHLLYLFGRLMYTLAHLPPG